MKITGEIIFTYNTENDAELVFDSLEVDNENYLESYLNENQITYTVNSSKLGSFFSNR